MNQNESSREFYEAAVKAIVDGDAKAAELNLMAMKGTASTNEELSLLTYLLHACVEWHRVGIAELLITQGAPIDGRDTEGDTPLMHAVRDCQIHIPMVRLLIDNGADADADNKGYRVIDYAQSADAPEHERTEALQILWKAPRLNRLEIKKK